MIKKIEQIMRDRGMSWRDFEEVYEGKITRALKRKMVFNIEKLNGMLEPLGIRLTIEKIEQ